MQTEVFVSFPQSLQAFVGTLPYIGDSLHILCNSFTASLNKLQINKQVDIIFPLPFLWGRKSLRTLCYVGSIEIFYSAEFNKLWLGVAR
jgi:hypothetical protein